jgi:hypothetical protein
VFVPQSSRRAAYHEERDTLHCDVDEEESKCAEVVIDVEDGTSDVMWPDLFVLIGATLRLEAKTGNAAFSLIEKPAFFRAARHQEWGAQAHKNGEQPFEEKNVAPGMNHHR